MLAHAQATKPLANDDILDLVKSGRTGESIVSVIAASDTAFDTSPEAITKLRNSGVTQRVIDSMLAAEAKKKAAQAPAAGEQPGPSIPETIASGASLSVQARAIPAGARFSVAPIPSGFDKFLLVSFFHEKVRSSL